MSKLLTFCVKCAFVAALFMVGGCDDTGQGVIDERFLWVGYYEAAETAQDPVTGFSSTVFYDLRIDEGWGSSFEVELRAVTGSIYGTSCILIGEVFQPEILSIPPYVCQLGPDEFLEITGYGEISPDGCCASIELTIDYCRAGFCQAEPPVWLELQKL